MTKIETLEDAVEVFKNQGHFNPDVVIETVGDLVGQMLHVASDPKVYDAHDDHLSLESDLSEEFMNTPIEDADLDRFAEERERVLEQANVIAPLAGLVGDVEADEDEDDMDEDDEDPES